MQSLTLTVTERCNLACTYCHARRSQRVMSQPVLDAALDLWSARSEGRARRSLSFYGGEPFLQPKLLRRALLRAREGASGPDAVRCMTPTNGLLVDPDLLALGLELAISIDAPGPGE